MLFVVLMNLKNSPRGFFGGVIVFSKKKKNSEFTIQIERKIEEKMKKKKNEKKKYFSR